MVCTMGGERGGRWIWIRVIAMPGVTWDGGGICVGEESGTWYAAGWNAEAEGWDGEKEFDDDGMELILQNEMVARGLIERGCIASTGASETRV